MPKCLSSLIRLKLYRSLSIYKGAKLCKLPIHEDGKCT